LYKSSLAIGISTKGSLWSGAGDVSAVVRTVKKYGILLFFASVTTACAPQISEETVCAQSREARADHAAALALSPDDRSVITGAKLIAMIDAGCAK